MEDPKGAGNGERVYYEDDAVKVTASTLNLDGRSYPVSSIRECKAEHTVSAYTTTGPLALPGKVAFLVGIAWLAWAGWQNWQLATSAPVELVKRLAIPLVVLIVGKVMAGQQSHTSVHKYNVLLVTDTGKQKALTRTDKAYVERVADAVNEAIAFQG